MSKLPRVTGEQAVKAFARVGFTVDRIKGAHYILKREAGGVRLTIPVHKAKTIGSGLLHSLIAAAGLTNEEFRELL